MKKWAILLWYLIYVTVLLSFNINPKLAFIIVLFSTFIVPLSFLNIIITIVHFIRDRRKWQRVLAVVMFLVSLYPLTKLYTVDLNGNTSKDGEIKLLSFNASFFRIPTVYSPEYWNPKQPTINDILVDWIVSQKADFVFIQEFFNDDMSAYFNNLQTIKEKGRFVDYYFINDPRHNNGTGRGLVIFSRQPILKKHTIFLGENRFNGAQEVITTWKSDTLRLVNLHLKSSEFELRQGSKSFGGFKNEVKKFFRDAVIRSEQVSLVLERLEEKNYPTIVCGDFNSTRLSYVYARMEEQYLNTFSEKGNGFGFTFSGGFRLPLKIDHQFHSGEIVPRTIHIVDSIGYSDHFPIVATYDLQR